MHILSSGADITPIFPRMDYGVFISASVFGKYIKLTNFGWS